MHANVYSEDVESGSTASVKFPHQLRYFELEIEFGNSTAVSFFSENLETLEDMLVDALLSVNKAKALREATATELQEAVAAKLREAEKEEHTLSGDI